MEALNVLGEPLAECGRDPLTGFFRDGCCTWTARDPALHSVCAVMTQDFLRYQANTGNDLTTAKPEFGFPGLQPGDRWCVVARRWLQAYLAGYPALVVLASTHEKALDVIALEHLRELAVDVPNDISSLI